MHIIAHVLSSMFQVGDELLEINGNSTEGMLHADAITIIKHGGEKVSLIIRRLPEVMRYSMPRYTFTIITFVFE